MKSDIKTGKHLYGRGWLGLIPLVGGFVGLGLIALGIFKYKDKRLIIIGSLALLLTISIYSLMFYDMKFGENTGKTYAKISQDLLNSLVKNLEFYKHQNGKYPDNLGQLPNDDPTVFINDPLLTKQMDSKLDTKFNYKKIGDSYILFSSGIDKKPNTKDDIYPTVVLKN